MRKADLVNQISEKTGIPKVDVLVTLETMFKEVKDTLSGGENIYIRGFGSFITKKRAAPGSTGPDPKALSRAFQKQQGRIENCFVSHVKEVDGRPEVSVKFRVDASGKVTSAELAPSALNATPLGGCIIGVARTTDFGRQPEPFSFTIPMTARRVK